MQHNTILWVIGGSWVVELPKEMYPFQPGDGLKFSIENDALIIEKEKV